MLADDDIFLGQPMEGFTSEFRDAPYPEEPLFSVPVPADSSMFSCFQILLNTAIGSGTLLIPYCYTLGIGTALLISLLFAVIAYMSLKYMIDAAFLTKSYDYRGLFARTFGQHRLWIINSMILLVQFGAAMIYAHWNGRLLSKIVGAKNPFLRANPFWIFLVESLTVFPLTLFRSISKLESIATLSTFFIVVLIAHAVYWFGHGMWTYGFDPQKQIAFFRMNTVAIAALSINSMAYNCHINLFACLEHLKDCSLRRARRLAWLTLGVAFALYNIFGLFTYLYLFDGIGEGSALEFYTEPSWFTTLTMAGVIVVLVCSSPLAIWAARNSLISMFFKSETTPLIWAGIGAGLCLASAFLASSSDNVILFFDIVGGLFTPTIIFLIPAMFYLKNYPNAAMHDKIGAYAIAGLTIVACVACTYHAISEILEKAK